MSVKKETRPIIKTGTETPKISFKLRGELSFSTIIRKISKAF